MAERSVVQVKLRPTREIAVSVQTVTTATQDASHAVHEVSGVSENTEAASQTVLRNAGEVPNKWKVGSDRKSGTRCVSGTRRGCRGTWPGDTWLLSRHSGMSKQPQCAPQY